MGSREARSGYGEEVRLTHIDGQVLVRVNLRGEEEQIARLFSLVEGRPDGRDDGRWRRSRHRFPQR